jgi:hypothetical protein
MVVFLSFQKYLPLEVQLLRQQHVHPQVGLTRVFSPFMRSVEKLPMTMNESLRRKDKDRNVYSFRMRMADGREEAVSSSIVGKGEATRELKTTEKGIPKIARIST